jgi:transposase
MVVRIESRGLCDSEQSIAEEGTMAKKRVSETLWNAIAPLLPEHMPSPKGGRPPVPDRACLEGIIFVLKTGMAWQMLPTRLGYGSGCTCWRRLHAWTQLGVWPELHRRLLRILGRNGRINLERAVIDSASVRALKGGRTPARTPRIGARMAANATS